MNKREESEVLKAGEQLFLSAIHSAGRVGLRVWAVHIVCCVGDKAVEMRMTPEMTEAYCIDPKQKIDSPTIPPTTYEEMLDTLMDEHEAKKAGEVNPQPRKRY